MLESTQRKRSAASAAESGVILGPQGRSRRAGPKRKPAGGSIINISSIYGLIGSSGSTAYHGTKGAVRLLAKCAAVQYARTKSG
jgi:NAD(P)-dependent dehydrogenase (short-subunit alcohol dehydrogenase family)